MLTGAENQPYIWRVLCFTFGTYYSRAGYEAENGAAKKIQTECKQRFRFHILPNVIVSKPKYFQSQVIHLV